MFGEFSHSGRVTGKLCTCITDDVYVHVKLAPSTLGVWSMAGLLGQPLEYLWTYQRWCQLF